MTTIPRSRALTATLTGVAAAAYYAVPDVTRSRAARGWLKAACLAAVAAASVPTSREEWHELRAARQDHAGDDVPDAGALDLADGDGTAPTRKAALAVAGVAVTVASVALTVAGEKWIYRRGEARAAAGVRFAHTRTGIVLGALTAALSLVDGPPRRS